MDHLSVVAQNPTRLDDEPSPDVSAVDEAKLSERLKQLGEDAASHRQAAELAQRTLEGLAMHSLEQRAATISNAWRELRYRESALAKRERELAQREQEFEKRRQALDGLKSALGIADE